MQELALVSAGGSFTLGFFSPPGEPAKRYLGIWFSFSPEAICWVANRDHPLNDTSGVLVLTKLGTLHLLDGSNNSVWSSGSTSPSPPTGARLLDSGNFVVVEGQNDSTFQWQSFDHPCNVLLPGMKIGKNRWNGDGWYHPGVGSYRYITELGGGTPENVLWDSNGTKKYRTGPWNGERFDGVPEMIDSRRQLVTWFPSASATVLLDLLGLHALISFPLSPEDGFGISSGGAADLVPPRRPRWRPHGPPRHRATAPMVILDAAAPMPKGFWTLVPPPPPKGLSETRAAAIGSINIDSLWTAQCLSVILLLLGVLLD